MKVNREFLRRNEKNYPEIAPENRDFIRFFYARSRKMQPPINAQKPSSQARKPPTRASGGRIAKLRHRGLPRLFTVPPKKIFI